MMGALSPFVLRRVSFWGMLRQSIFVSVWGMQYSNRQTPRIATDTCGESEVAGVFAKQAEADKYCKDQNEDSEYHYTYTTEEIY